MKRIVRLAAAHVFAHSGVIEHVHPAPTDLGQPAELRLKIQAGIEAVPTPVGVFPGIDADEMGHGQFLFLAGGAEGGDKPFQIRHFARPVDCKNRMTVHTQVARVLEGAGEPRRMRAVVSRGVDLFDGNAFPTAGREV